MKKINILCLILTILCLGALTSEAAIFRSGDIVIIPAHRTINDNLYIAAEDIHILGKVKGDIFAIGKNIKIRGGVDGDIFAAGEYLNIAPKYANDLRLLGKRLYVRGRIAKDVMAAGQRLFLSGRILGNAYTASQYLKVSRYAKINGVLQYSADKSVISRRARIGRIIKETPDQAQTCVMPEKESEGMGWGVLSGISFIHILMLLLLAWVFVKYTPNQVKLISKTIMTSSWKSMGIGFLSLFMIPILIGLLLITIVGIPFGLILLFCYILALYLSKVFIAFSLGEWLSTKFSRKPKKESKQKMAQRPFRNFIIGIIFYYLLTMIPVLGGYIQFFALLIGLGAIVSSRFVTYKLARKKAVI
ncbi:hypothetical protein ACFL5G_05375 [Candidatus Margulisiibacteriota bacterium]